MFGAERKVKPDVQQEQKQRLYDPKLPKKRTLRDNPQPITNTPAMKNLINEEREKEAPMETESLKEIHPSIIAQPRIDGAKKEAREERKQELNTVKEGKFNPVDEDVIMSPGNKNTGKANTTKDLNPSKKEVSAKDKKRTPPKHIKMVNQTPGYDIVNDLATTQAKISYAQLLDASPKIRAELVKSLKLDKENPLVGLVHKGRIAISRCKMNGIPSNVYLDYGAGINLISKEYFEKLPKQPEPIGVANYSIVQVLSDTDSTPGLIYRLPLTIGSYTFEADFRLVDRENLRFDIIICYETIVENYLFINPITLEVCRMNSNIEISKFKKIFEEIQEKYQIWEVIEDLEKLDRSDEMLNETNRLLEDTPGDDMINLVLIEEERTVENKALAVNCSMKTNVVPDRKMVLDEIILKRIGTKNDKLVIKMRALLERYDDIIAISTDDLNRTKLFPHSIVLKEGSLPVKQRSYRLPKAKADILKEELTKLLNKKLIVPSHSPWSFPIVLHQKKNGKWRLCIDYRKLNELTIKDSYSIPFIEEILFSIGSDVKAISTIDLFSGYHQIPMDEKDIEKTSFTTMFGNFNFVVMPFGLTNAPATFQREMNRIFFPLIGKCMFVYIDDLVVFSPNIEQHFRDLYDVFEIIKDNGLKINIEKCNFLMNEVEVLGHMLSVDGIKPVEKKVEIIKYWEAPKDVSGLRSFLGSVGYYRKFIPNFSKIANPLFQLLKKDVPFVWDKNCQSSFEDLKEKLLNYPILRFPDFKRNFIIRTDASYEGFGGVLIQKYDKMEYPIQYVSRSLRKEEKNYSVSKLEGAAAYFCAMKFKPFIMGNEFDTILYTDHKPLIGLFNKRTPIDQDRQLTNWILTFSMLKIIVKYEEGRKNHLADALSRIPISVNTLTTNPVGVHSSSSPLDPSTTLMDEYIDSKIVKIDDLEYYKDGTNLRKVIHNEDEKTKLLLEAHAVGHEGIFKTYNRLRRDFYWPNMLRDVKLVVKTCPKCQMFRSRPMPREESIPTPAEAPFVRVGLDIVGPLYTTRKNNQYIIVLVDYFTGWVEARPLQSTESSEVISFLLDVFSRHGIPEVVIEDNGPQFISSQTKGFLDIYNVYIKPATTYHPETNGKVENRNKEIGKYLRLLSEQEKDWDDILPSVLWAIRTTKSEKTKFSSFELLYGRRDKQPFELMVNLDQAEPYESREEYVIRKFINHRKWIKEAIANIENANELWRDRRKQSKRMKKNYSAGDLVLVRYLNRRKLDPYFLGPLKVVKTEFNTVTLCDPRTGEILDRNVHKKNIIPYVTMTTSRDEVSS